MLGISNWSTIMENFMQWSTQGYTTALGFFFYPVFFAGIIGYIYIKNQSLTVTAGAILIIVAVFGNVIMGIDAFVNLLWVITALIFTAVIIVFIKRRKG